MKQYTGTKVIHAKPMTRKEYNDLREWEVPNDENPSDEGYLVEYVDSDEPNHTDFKGYISWSPKDVFERAYKPSNTPIERIQIEIDELDERLGKLGEFLTKPKPDFLNDDEWDLLHEQQEHMCEYYNVLNMRLAIAKAKNK